MLQQTLVVLGALLLNLACAQPEERSVHLSSEDALVTGVHSLAELRLAVQQSNQTIVMAPGDYNLETGLPSGGRDIDCAGSNNSIDLTGVYIEAPVGSVSSSWFRISGDGNTVTGGEIEDVYKNDISEVSDFSAYNQDRNTLAKGLGGDAVLTITGSNNLLDGLKLTTRGSFPYGYGSMFGIGAGNTYGLNKRCAILITGGDGNVIDHVEIQHRAFGHGIYIQDGSTGSVVRNTLVEGKLRRFAELHTETNTYDLPYRSDYLMPFFNDEPIPMEGLTSLCEDGIRAYNRIGSVTVENCVVKKMRGGIRLYLAAAATVTNSTAIDCGDTNFNLPSGGSITGSAGNFSYGPLNDNRLGRSNQEIDLAIIPSPLAEGPHNIADVLGNSQTIRFRRTPGPLDSDEGRVIYVSGNNSSIVNDTEYTILLTNTASGNDITSAGPVIDNGSNNNVTSKELILQTGPLGLVATPGDKTVFLNWTLQRLPAPASYDIYRTTVPGSYGNPLATSEELGEYVDLTVRNGLTYYYQVKAAGLADGVILESSEVSGTPVALPSELFANGFEGGFGPWENGGAFNSSGHFEGNSSAKLNNTDYVETSVDTSGQRGILISYARNTEGLEAGDSFTSEWFDGSNWQTIENISVNFTDWELLSEVRLPAAADNNPDLRIRFRVDSGSHFAFVDSVVVERAPHELTYQAWALEQGLIEGVNSDYEDDPDKDGRTNLLEYAIGADPLTGDTGSVLPIGTLSVHGNAEYLEFAYNRRIDADLRGLSYDVLSGDNLSMPMTNPTEESGISLRDGGFERVTNRIPVHAGTARFMRLEVTAE